MLPRLYERVVRVPDGPVPAARDSAHSLGGALPPDQELAAREDRDIPGQGAGAPRFAVHPQRGEPAEHDRGPDRGRGAHPPGRAPRCAARGPEDRKDDHHGRDLRVLGPHPDDRRRPLVPRPLRDAPRQEGARGRAEEGVCVGHLERPHRHPQRVHGVAEGSKPRARQGLLLAQLPVREHAGDDPGHEVPVPGRLGGGRLPERGAWLGQVQGRRRPLPKVQTRGPEVPEQALLRAGAPQGDHLRGDLPERGHHQPGKAVRQVQDQGGRQGRPPPVLRQRQAELL
mmetsp:Transcript_12429/g.34589  ORF Transcript_12429/g.34589 Transcript_12429/m.34589 type:complete len:284 (-) Transcript_12429:604-1455(-)